jgi:hypothetical protein
MTLQIMRKDIIRGKTDRCTSLFNHCKSLLLLYILR